MPIRDQDQMLCLTDMWRAAGAPPDKRPAEWKRYEGATFIGFLAETMNVGSAHIWNAERGSGGATFAHWQIAMAYAKHLSPAHPAPLACPAGTPPDLGRFRGWLRAPG